MTANASSSQWFECFRGTSFPLSPLPTALSDYVVDQRARYHENECLVAATSLTQLAGVAAEDTVSSTGSPVSLPFNLIVAVPHGASSHSLDERNTVLEHCQRERINAAAMLTKKRVEQLLNAPSHQLPEFIPGGDPRTAMEARLQAMHAAQRPIFWIEGGGSQEIRAGYAASADATLLLTYTHTDVIKHLNSKPDRECRRLQELIGRLASGGAIELPKSRGSICSLAQARMGLLAVTNQASLHKAVICERPSTQALVRNSVLLTVEGTKTMPPTASQVRAAVWDHWIRSLLNSRLHNDGLEPHPSFYHELEAWEPRLQELRQNTPNQLRAHLAPFINLPLKLASLFLALEHYGGFRDGEAAKGAIKVTEWLMARTLLTASDAYNGAEHVTQTEARESMLAKIVEYGPIDFWRLCRRFHNQDKQLHQSTLEALLQERRIRLNSEGKLEAA